VAVRPVLRFPHPALKRKAPSLSPHEHARIERVAGDLLDTMRANKGCVGLAAPQIDEAVRLVVVDVTEHPRADTSNGLLVLADPLVVAAEGAEVAREGCLSIPTLTANVRRATRITVEGKEPSGDPHHFESQGWTVSTRSPPTCSGGSAPSNED
jgi:peptide deformylase